MQNPHDKAESKYNTDVGISKEDEERYQKLLSENEELQRLIVQVSLFIYIHMSIFPYTNINNLYAQYNEISLTVCVIFLSIYRKKVIFVFYNNV